MPDDDADESNAKGEETNTISKKSEADIIREAREELKKENDEFEAEKLRGERLRAEKLQGGESQAGQEIKTPEAEMEAKAKEQADEIVDAFR